MMKCKIIYSLYFYYLMLCRRSRLRTFESIEMHEKYLNSRLVRVCGFGGHFPSLSLGSAAETMGRRVGAPVLAIAPD